MINIGWSHYYSVNDELFKLDIKQSEYLKNRLLIKSLI
jgi:hypothetical protein